jgi:cell wall assembly regulator SMI1
MMIAEKLAQIERFLARQGIALQVTRQPPLDSDDIADAERFLGHPIPHDLTNIYTRFANGFEVFWKEVRSPTDSDFGRFSLPTLQRFLQDTARFREDTREEYDNADKYLEHPNEARLVLQRMLNWGVLWDTGGDGNFVCIDLENGAVVFHEREWSFYDSYDNGYIIARSVNRLIEEWGNVCFLFFPGAPGDCPAHGDSAMPDYAHQEFNMSNEERPQERTN